MVSIVFVVFCFVTSASHLFGSDEKYYVVSDSDSCSSIFVSPTCYECIPKVTKQDYTVERMDNAYALYKFDGANNRLTFLDPMSPHSIVTFLYLDNLKKSEGIDWPDLGGLPDWKGFDDPTVWCPVPQTTVRVCRLKTVHNGPIEHVGFKIEQDKIVERSEPFVNNNPLYMHPLLPYFAAWQDDDDVILYSTDVFTDPQSDMYHSAHPIVTELVFKPLPELNELMAKFAPAGEISNALQMSKIEEFKKKRLLAQHHGTSLQGQPFNMVWHPTEYKLLKETKQFSNIIGEYDPATRKFAKQYKAEGIGCNPDRVAYVLQAAQIIALKYGKLYRLVENQEPVALPVQLIGRADNGLYCTKIISIISGAVDTKNSNSSGHQAVSPFVLLECNFQNNERFLGMYSVQTGNLYYTHTFPTEQSSLLFDASTNKLVSVPHKSYIPQVYNREVSVLSINL